jgi:uncharacterized membrane protein
MTAMVYSYVLQHILISISGHILYFQAEELTNSESLSCSRVP